MKTYYLLTKPGIIMGNLVTMVAGFALACRGTFDFFLFFKVLIGLGLVIASACVCNNYIDRESDRKMNRTKNRALAKGDISGKRALFFAVALGVFGMAILILFVNVMAALMASIGFLIYVAPYSLLKVHTEYATLIGSIAGAIPPVVGYVAVMQKIDLGALLLFAVLVLWQMPHFYSIAIYAFKDYQKAAIPVLPVVKGIHKTKIQILAYIGAFLLCAPLLTFFGYTGYAYLAAALILGVSWLAIGFKGMKSKEDVAWAKGMFFASLVIILSLCTIITVTSG